MLDALPRRQAAPRYRLQAAPYPLLRAGRRHGAVGKPERQGTADALQRGGGAFDMTLSQTRAIEELGYRPRYSMEEGIRQLASGCGSRRHTAWLRSPYLKWAGCTHIGCMVLRGAGFRKFPARAYLLEGQRRCW